MDPHRSQVNFSWPLSCKAAALRPLASVRPWIWNQIRPSGRASNGARRGRSASSICPATLPCSRASSNTSMVRFMIRAPLNCVRPRKAVTSMTVAIVLASSSAYRRQLLERLRLPFDAVAPAVDESFGAGETPTQIARRLALLKAEAVAARYPDAIVIGSDQAAEMNCRPIGQPLTHDAALEQLLAMQGRGAVFYTALALVLVPAGYIR